MDFVHLRAQRVTRIILTAMCAGSITACSSFDGGPRPVIALADNLAMIRPYSMNVALVSFMASDDKDRQGLSKLQYRNLVVALYLNAMDAQYASFRTRLSRQRKGGSLALGLTSLGLTTAVPLVATGVKDALSALATGATGTRAALDKELYFDQALPALLAAMEAERANTKAEILQHLKQTVDNYPLDLAFAELNQYQMSATFERAIDKITADANADRTVALRKVGAA
ncbi:MAG: hypothetical protein LC656_09940 [Sphingomonadales bacterium]|nr:hypothetical protein [Sphingomonadales bacterium]